MFKGRQRNLELPALREFTSRIGKQRSLDYINLQIWLDRDWRTEFQIARDVFITYTGNRALSVRTFLQIEYRLLCAKCERGFLLRPYGIAPGSHSPRQSERERLNLKRERSVTRRIFRRFGAS